MTKKIVKRTDTNNETLYFYTHSDAVDVGEGSSTKSLTEVLDDTLHKSPQTLTNAEKTQVHANLGTESFVGDRAVRYDEAQVLGSSEKTQALVNLGLNGVDEVPTENSNNVVRSGGVKAAIDDVIDDFTNRGFMYKGIAPVSAPLGEDKTFYIAKSGDYSAYTGIGNDGSFTLNGIAVLTYATATTSGAWTKNDIVLFDEEPTAGSNNLVKSGGVEKSLSFLRLIGNNDNLVTSSIHNAVKGGSIYRFVIKYPEIDMDGVSYTNPGNIMLQINEVLNDNTVNQLLLIGCDKKAIPLKNYYDLQLSDNAIGVQIKMRASANAEQVIILEEITDVVSIKKIIDGYGFGFRDIEYTTNDGYIDSNGVIQSSQNYKYSSPIQLLKGETIIGTFIANVVAAIALTNSSATYYIQVVNGNSSTARVYSYTASEDCYVAFSYRTNYSPQVEILLRSIISESCELVSSKLSDIQVSSEMIELGSLTVEGGAPSPAANRARTKDYIRNRSAIISVNSGAKYSLRYYDKYNVFVSASDWLTNPTEISDDDNIKIVVAYTDDRTISNFSDLASFFSLEGIVTRIEHVEKFVQETKIPLIGETASFVKGTISTTGYDSFSETRVRSALIQNIGISVSEGYKVSLRYYNENKTYVASDENFRTGNIYPNEYPWIRIVAAYEDDSNISDINDFTSNVIPKGIIWTVQNLGNLPVKVKELDDSLNNLLCSSYKYEIMQCFNDNNLLKSFSLKAIKLSNAASNIEPIPLAWLYIDNDTQDMYLAEVSPYGSLRKIGTWDRTKTWNGTCDSSWYSIAISPENDLICVFRTERLWNGTVGRDSDRKNPIIYPHTDYENPVVVDFGEDEAPSAWLMSCGHDFTYNDKALHFAEYGRPNLVHSNVWKVVYPYTSKSNWSIVQYWATSGHFDIGFKHCHCCEVDPFSGTIYVATGDDDSAAMIYASTDGGDTFSLVAGPNEKKCRLLNFIFTKDYIWWASDSHGPRHALFRASRDNGVMDADSIEVVTQIPYSQTASYQATYATCYDKEQKLLIFLDRYDGEGYAEPMSIYGYDIVNSKIIKLFEIEAISSGKQYLGFRCEVVGYYQPYQDKCIACGWQWAENPNAILNNSASNKLSNLAIIITATRKG